MAGERRATLLRGTLDLLVLRTLELGPLHGHGIGKHIQQTTENVLTVDHGSLYPALARLEKNGYISSRWENNAARGREMRIYTLTAKGRKYLEAEETRWAVLVRAMNRMLRRAGGQ
jgi:transcriptional regulator